ncbi:hypothetical protein H4R33_006148 [Dimargaris cristalligena]|nr:hypothetical protein H4R33_006148 [Dimargaris cristalligena]
MVLPAPALVLIPTALGQIHPAPVNPYGPSTQTPVSNNHSPYGSQTSLPALANQAHRPNNRLTVNTDDILTDYYQDSATFANPTGGDPEKAGRRYLEGRDHGHPPPGHMELADLTTRTRMAGADPYSQRLPSSGHNSPHGHGSRAGTPTRFEHSHYVPPGPGGSRPPMAGGLTRPFANHPPGPHSPASAHPRSGPPPGPMGYGGAPSYGPGPDLTHRRPSETSTIYPSDSVSQYGQTPPMAHPSRQPPNQGRFAPGPGPGGPYSQLNNYSNHSIQNPNLATLDSPLPAGVTVSGGASSSSHNAMLSNPLPPGVTVSAQSSHLGIAIPPNNGAAPGGIPPSPPPPPLPYDKSPERYAAYETRGDVVSLSSTYGCM